MVDPGGTSDDEDAGLPPGTRLGKYEVVRLLGMGGMGAVYEAVHVDIGKRVAVKVLSPAIAAVSGARARFLREAQLTSRVRHPNIVDVTDMGSDGGQTYLVMELLRGEDLCQRVRRVGPLPPEQVADIMLPVCSAVVEAHKAGITHRDLKPQNIFLAAGPHTLQPKVLDFGISKGSDLGASGGLTGTGAMIGTPFYLAPEQIVDNRAAGPASDQYALGVIMYECLAGRRPFEAENLFVVFQAIVAGNPLPPSHFRPGIPPALEGVVLRAMHLEPTARFPNAAALGRALLPFASARTRSIWEDAFVTPQDTTEPALAAPLLTTTLGGAARKPFSGAAPMATPTPPGIVPRTTPMPVPGARLGGRRPAKAGDGGLAAGAPRPGATISFDEATSDRESAPFEDAPPTRSRFVRFAVIGGGILTVVAVALAWPRSGARPPEGPANGGTIQTLPQPTVHAPVGTSTRASTSAEDVTKTGAADALEPGSASGTAGELKAETTGGLPSAPREGSSSTTAAAPADHSGIASPDVAPPGPQNSNDAKAVELPTFFVSISVEPSDATIELDGETVGQGRFETTLPLDRTRHKLHLFADGYQDRVISFTGRPPPALVKLIPSDAPPFARDPYPFTRPGRRPRSPEPANSQMLNPNGAPVID